jgi:formate hydrogenlyase subunit 4
MVTMKISGECDVKVCCLVEVYLLLVDSAASIIRRDQDITVIVHFCQITWHHVAVECILGRIVLLPYSFLW